MRMFRKVLLTFGLLLMAEVVALAQGTMKGKITDAETKEPLPFVNVIVKQDGKQVHGGTTDFDGDFTIKPLAVGTYDVEVSFVGYARYQRTGVQVKASGFTIVNVELKSTATTMDVLEIVDEKVPVIEIGSPEQGQRLSSEDIAHMPGNSVESIVAAVGGMGYSDGGTGTARGEGGMVTMQGGVRKRTGINVPKDAIAEIQVILGGTPASIGEAIGGTQIITLKPPTSQFMGMVRWEGYLDYRLLNTLVFYLTGPVYKKNIVNADGSSMERTLVGFRFTGQANYRNSPFYRVKGYRYQKVKDELVYNFEQHPLDYNPLDGTINYTAETGLRASDFEEFTNLNFNSKNFVSKDRFPNLQYYSIATEGALDFRFSDYATLTLTGEFSYVHSPSASISPLTMNLQGASVTEQTVMGLTVDFTQRFPDAEASNEDEAKAASPVKNVMYNITAMVNRVLAKSYNENFGSSIDDIFKYGYIGQFITEKKPTYENKLIDYYGNQRWAMVQNNWGDEVTYVSGSGIYNPILANYNEQLFFDPEFQDIKPMLFTMDNIRGYKGLYNGDSPSSIYGLTNVGVQGGSYATSQDDYLYIQAKASADIHGHEIEIGFNYDQLWNSSFSIGSYGLWTLMRDMANTHISQMDLDNPIYETRGSQLYVNYNRLLDASQQTYFDRAFRDYLIANGFTQTDGTPIDELTWIDIDRYMPDDFVKAGGLDMFSTDELYNSGNAYVSFYGYDHTGKKYSGSNWSLDKFFNPSDGKMRQLPAFSPIYAAGYIQDKFYFQDLIFNVGVRVDYFNGNQYVMKDPYLLYEAYTVKDIRNHPELYSGGGQYLASAGDDWVPYVDQVSTDEGASKPVIKGYRDSEGHWYDANGREVTTPSAISGNSGRPTPFYTDRGVNSIKNRIIDADATFERYQPKICPMPRIAFSFPIGEKSQFKASYDIIYRRPSSGWQASYVSYLFMDKISSISNPNLQPERITNYELGFQQALNESSAISISAYYKETRDLIQLIQYVGADPNPNYYSYGNKDFRTIKGLTLAYDLRKTKNIRINANYTLQYAEGTGLSSSTMTELIKEGYITLKMLNPISDDRRHEFKANVDFRYGAGKQYNGPVITRVVTDKETGEKRKKDINLLENFGVNFMAVAQSGRPYTRAFSNAQSTIVGSYNGARLPWGFYFDIAVDKVWPIKVGKRDTYITALISVTNLFNIRNVLGVFSVTGNPEDNGYLTDPEMQEIINAQLDPQAYRDIYAISLRNGTWNYSSPRIIRLSLSYNF